MGSWQLEVIRMTSYVFFPVMTFYMYHTPFMQRLLDNKRLVHVSEPVEDTKESKFLRMANERRDKRRMKRLEENIWKEDY